MTPQRTQMDERWTGSGREGDETDESDEKWKRPQKANIFTIFLKLTERTGIGRGAHVPGFPQTAVLAYRDVPTERM